MISLLFKQADSGDLSPLPDLVAFTGVDLTEDACEEMFPEPLVIFSSLN